MEEEKVEIVKGAGSNAKDIANTFRNYKPFKNNFGDVIVLKQNGTYFVYLPQRAEYDQYIYMTDKKDNLEGWFYGAVQTDNGIIPKLQTESKITEGKEYDYMLLDRLRSDCDYYLGNGNRQEKYLWAKDVDAQIAKMKELYNSLEEKPEWLTMEDIENYEKEMKNSKVEESTEEIELPDVCYTYIDSTNEVAIIKKNEGGYYPTDIDTSDMSEEQIKEYIDKQNEFLEVTPEQADEMKRKSMFVWGKENNKLNESLLDTLTNTDKLKINISNEAIKMLQAKFNVSVVGSYDDDEFEFDITGDANEVLDAVDYIKEQVSDKFDMIQERKRREDKQFCVTVILKTK